jgi:ferrochelatase
MVFDMMHNIAYLLVNFGGPRDLMEIEEFLISLLTDQEVIRTPFPKWLHRILFKRVAKKRTKKVLHDYISIGGKSPIYEDTEAIAKSAGEILKKEVITFHRYLPKTHPGFIEKMEQLHDVDEIQIFPMFPQFTFATTGSIALWFAEHLSMKTVEKLRWVKSYPAHSRYIETFESCIREFLTQHRLKEEECILLFSAHGLPQRFIATGDVYQNECRITFDLLKQKFPLALPHLCYQSQFGKEEWIRPYTSESCENIGIWGKGRKSVVVVPLSFTSDHIETLYEIEQLYLPMIRKSGMLAYRCPALNQREDWIETIGDIFKEGCFSKNRELLRH